MLGLVYAYSFGLITQEEIYLMPTVYGAQIVGGLIFGVGFVMAGWCPGTAAVGMASGKLDALVFSHWRGYLEVSCSMNYFL